MEYNTIIFWFVCFSCATGVVVTLKRGRAAGIGWSVLFLVILLTAVAGWLMERAALVYAAGAMWLVLVLLPGLLGTLYYRRFLQQKYSAAYRLARIIGWLHPADGWRQQPQIVRAVDLAQRGELPAAMEALKRFQDAPSVIGLTAMPVLYRITGQWEELFAWEVRHSREIERMPQLLHVRLRARGETGDLRGLVELYDRHNAQIGKLTPAPSRDLCRLMLFAFCGKRALAERLFAGSLTILPAATQRFWLATADLAAGNYDAAKRELEQLLPSADAPMRLAIERRLALGSAPREATDTYIERVIEAAALEQSHDDRFGARPTLFSKLARATQLLIVLNLMMFGAELCLGGSTSAEALFRLGALFPPAVRGGEWWRLIAAIFLHFGALHLAMNMIALWMLGPFTEFALGFRRFLLIYLLTGIGSMGFVMAFASGPTGEQLTVGASGSVMGLIGATGALMLRGWWREKAKAAQRRLIAMLSIVAMQAAFDSVVPQVSMAAHLSGAVIGFMATLLLSDRLMRGRGME